MQLEDLKVGRGLEIYVTKGGYRYRLVSTIEGVAPGKVYVTLIASGSRVFQFASADQVDVVYHDETHMLQWKNVKGSIAEFEKTKVHCLASRKPGESFNRRNSFRVEIGEEIVMNHFITEEQEEGEQPENGSKPEILDYDEYDNEVGKVKSVQFEAILKDISEKGVGFCTNRKLDLEDHVGFALYTSFGAMYFKAEIIRHMDIRSGKYMEFYGASFIRSDKNISKYLFTLQRERLKRQRLGAIREHNGKKDEE